MSAYDTIAAFYEAEHGQLEADVAYYSRFGGTGRLLVLGCGTGRVGRVLGSQRSITGLDQSPAMLEIARHNAPHAEYVLGNMTDFDLGQFAEIIIPNGAFNFLATRAEQHRCLSCCARALATGGELVIDMPMPSFALLGVPHSPEREAWEGQVGDERAVRTREIRRFPARQRLELCDRYYVGGEVVASTVLPLRLVFPAEAEWMLESCGFAVDALHGNYSGATITDSSPRIIVRGVRVSDG